MRTSAPYVIVNLARFFDLFGGTGYSSQGQFLPAVLFTKI